jgi:hypothetical protein
MYNFSVSNRNVEGYISDFFCFLPSCLQLDRNAEYEIALSEVFIPVTWPTFSSPQYISLADGSGAAIKLCPAYFETINKLLEHLNSLLQQEAYENTIDESGLFANISFELNPLTRRVTVKNDTTASIILPEGQLSTVLGFGGKMQELQGGTAHEAPNPVSTLPTALLHVHLDILLPNSLIGSVALQQDCRWGSYASKVFKKLTFKPITQRSVLDCIRIQLVNNWGELLTFQTKDPVQLNFQLRERYGNGI